MFTDENGVFTEEFKTKLPEFLGAEHKDMQFDIPDIPRLVKAYADNKAFAGKKLENVIQKPAKDAKPEDIQAYNKALLKELGGVQSEADLKDINWKAGIPDGVDIDKNLIDGITKFAAKKGYPKSFIKELVEDFYNPIMMNSYNEQQKIIKAEEEAAAAAAKAAREEKVKLINDTYKGDALVENLRKTMPLIEFIADDGLKAKMKEVGLYSNPTLENFEKAGIPLENIISFAKIASKIETAKLVGTGNSNGTKSARQVAMEAYPGAPWMWPAE
jgi:hypothetical protein